MMHNKTGMLCFALLSVVQIAAQGHIDTIRFESAESGGPRYMTVYTPEAYCSDSTYPVLYLLHGIRGNQYAWEQRAHIRERADSLIRKGLIRPLVIVMPLCTVHDTTQAYRLPSYCKAMHDYNHHIKRGEFEEVFWEYDNYIRQHYSVDSSMIAGLSSGGRQALNLSRTYHFQIVGLFSPVVLKTQVPKTNTGTVYWIRCGRRDMFYARSRRTNHKLNRKQIPHDFQKTSGRHNWQNWCRYIDDFLQYRPR